MLLYHIEKSTEYRLKCADSWIIEMVLADNRLIVCSEKEGIAIWEFAEGQEGGWNRVTEFRELPDADVAGCDFTEAVFASDDMREMIRANGGLVLKSQPK